MIVSDTSVNNFKIGEPLDDFIGWTKMRAPVLPTRRMSTARTGTWTLVINARFSVEKDKSHEARTKQLGLLSRTRSVVRGFMWSKEATPFIVKADCIQHPTVFIAKIRNSNQGHETSDKGVHLRSPNLN